MARAKEACKTVSWFSNAMKSASTEPPKAEESPLQALATEGIQKVLAELGSRGPKFQKKIEKLEKRIQSTNYKEFDPALMELGGLLGFNSWKPEGGAKPDCVWQLGSELAFLLEGKADESAKGGISVADWRQARG